ncbi:MAG TPA: caspase family protein [Noviherbaspirillum sp.]|uniref:caspase family protein n=1 Tax=Noviherbaspirillum sp. TaxID=1926288 RepID=UPI002D664F23|nr:caspase family protein [Noviherbaspirillum sp.]HYD97509.1 caspase family protein [Noviherbaspirillum sp.]
MNNQPGTTFTACRHTRRQLLKAAAAAACCYAGAGLARAQGTGSSALVIGNGDYGVSPLRNPVNDARLIGDTLDELGYRVVSIVNAPMQRTLDAARSWISASAGSHSRIFYFAGHGVQSGGKNFLIPVDADIRAEDEVPFKAINAMDIVDRLSRFDDGVNIVILDACRSSPFPLLAGNIKGRGVNNNAQQGLAAANAPRGTLIAYSTSPGAVAIDGGRAGNSVYTRQLAAQMRVEGLPVELLFKRVRQAVMQETRHAQVPWESSSLTGDFCFRPDARGGCGDSGRDAEVQSIDLKRIPR